MRLAETFVKGQGRERTWEPGVKAVSARSRGCSKGPVWSRCGRMVAVRSRDGRRVSVRIRMLQAPARELFRFGFTFAYRNLFWGL